jgi:hypothetical protein
MDRVTLGRRSLRRCPDAVYGQDLGVGQGLVVYPADATRLVQVVGGRSLIEPPVLRFFE